MGLLHALIPSLTILVLTFVAELPWGLPAEWRFLLPLIPFIAVHFWALRRPARLPAPVVFVAGLMVDVMTLGPLGYWALVYLSGYALTLLASGRLEGGPVLRWLLFIAIVAALAVLEWLIAALYFMERVDWHPFAHAAALACLAYLPVAALLRAVDLEARTIERPMMGRGV